MPQLKPKQPKLLKPLKWTNPNNGNENDMSFTPSPTHDYTIEAVGERFDVRYHNRFTEVSDRTPDFDTLEAAQIWVGDTHAEEKILEWCVPYPQSTLARCSEWFMVANPNPVLENVVVQLGVHCEEVAEMFDVMGEKDAAAAVRAVAKKYKASAPEAMQEMADILLDEARTDGFTDAIIDQAVTGNGTLTNMGVDIEILLTRVNESNFSKFVEGKAVRETPNGKIQKGPDYFEPNLCDYIELSGEALLESLEPYKG